MEPLRPGDPRQIGSYRLLGRLGAGGMGEVFLGESPGHRKVAVKLVRAEHSDEAMFRERFRREVEAARKVGGFHTAQVVDADPDADPPWLVTAYIPGPSLAEQIRDHGPMPAGEVRRLGAALAEGLAAIHACGLVHRDLKPGNIILAADGPRIIDFGVARAPGASSLTSTGGLVGTVAFMSPEQVHGEQVDARSDVFSLGSVLVYAATGRGPFDAETMAAMVYRVANTPPELGGIGSGLREVIEGCLAKDRAQRLTLPDLTVKLTDQNPDVAERPIGAVPVVPPPVMPPVMPPAGPPVVPPMPAQPPGMPPGYQQTGMPPVYQPTLPVRRRKRLPTPVISLLAVLGAAAAGVLFYYVGVNGASANQPGADGSPSPSASRTASPVTSSPAASASASQAPSPSATSIPSLGVGDVSVDFIGAWTGTLDDNTGFGGSQTANVVIYGGKVKSLVGLDSYPDSDCEFNATLVSADAKKLIIKESADSGGGCDSEYAVLVPSGSGSGSELQEDIYETYPSGDSSPDFSGTLTRS